MQPSLLHGERKLEMTHWAEPVQWQAPESVQLPGGKRIHYSPKAYKVYKEALSQLMRYIWIGDPDIGEFWIKLEFHCGSEGRKKPRDYDNMAKTVGDAGNKVVWKDDSQITLCKGIEVFRHCPNPHTTIWAGLR